MLESSLALTLENERMTLKENAGLIKESQLFKIKRNVQESQFLV